MDSKVVLLPSYSRVEQWRKRAAGEIPTGLLGTTAATFDSWIADLWELHGDGRALVSGVQRRMLLRRALAECGFFAEDEIAFGLVSMAARVIRSVAGLIPFERACTQCAGDAAPDSPFDLDKRECALLAACARYESLLAAAGLVEPGTAAAYLAEHAETVFPRPLHAVLPDGVPMDWSQQAFFASCSSIHLVVHPDSGTKAIGCAPEDVRLRFAFPSGPTAQAGLVADILREAAHDEAAAGSPGDDAEWFAVVTCHDPLEMYGMLGPVLAQEGMSVAVQGRKALSQTAFGCAYLSMLRCLHSDPWDPAALADVLLSPFSGVPRAEAYDIARDLRLDRIASRDGVLARLRAAFEPLSQLEELASDPDADILLGMFEQMVQSRVDLEASWRSEQLAAIGAVRAVLAAARFAGLPIRACADELEHAAVPVSMALQPACAGPAVLIASQEDAATLGSHACQVLVAADLTTDAYPVADREDAAATLLSHLGFAPYDDALSQARRCFTALLALPIRQAVMVRPLNDEDAAETYPCLVLEELADAYRDKEGQGSGAGRSEGAAVEKPPALTLKGAPERGEDVLFENAVALPVGGSQAMQSAPSGPPPAGGVLLPRRTSHGEVLPRACPSPSAIESYLECPRKWFIDRRISAEQIDEGFGGREKGTFAHEAFRLFYERFQAAGHAKVGPGNLDAARACMADVLDELEAAQPLCEPGSNRLVPATELERRELADFKRQLEECLEFEAQFLPGWRPAYLEYEIDADHAVEYAGYRLVGRIDRIDVDDAGHAVIVDYKGGVTDDYAIAGKTPVQMGKVQTRIYAQAVKRALGLDVVGALYVTYGRNPRVSGAYNPCIIDAAHLPGIRTSACACAADDAGPALEPLSDDLELASLTFEHMLDATECVVGAAVARMAAGDVRPRPAADSVCRYCAAPACAKRGDGR